MKRNKYRPNHYMNSARKRNCIRIKPKFDKSIEYYTLTEIIENSSNKMIAHNYMKCITDIMNKYYEENN